MLKHKMYGEADYPERGVITDEDVWQLVKKHSRFIDRINNRKMVEMAIAAQLILFGIYEEDGWYANQDDWTFYGRNGFYTLVADTAVANKKQYKRRYSV